MQQRGQVDQRTDVYSLGLTLYELLTLEPAFPIGDDRPNLLRRIAEDEPIPPRKLDPSIPSDLETIVQKAMAKDPADRYPSALDLADDLGRFRAKLQEAGRIRLVISDGPDLGPRVVTSWITI